MSVFTPHPSILWRQVWGLAAILAAILVSFMIYGMYQPQILTELGFVQLTAILGIIQGLMAAVIEPLLGGLSDRILRRFGSRLPQITVGVTLAGLLFVIIAVLLKANMPPTFRWLFLLLMGFWLTAMIAIRGPIVGLLIQFAPTKELPIANGILILVLGLVGALNPILELFFHQMGKSLSFTIGAILLLVSSKVFFSTIPRHVIIANIPVVEVAPISPQSASKLRFMLITLVGVGAGVEINILFTVFIPRLQIEIFSGKTTIIYAIVMLIAAIAANPLGWLTSRWGAVKAMQVGFAGMLLLMAIAFLTLNTLWKIGLLMGFGVAFGLVFISMVPFALASVPFHQTGLSIGLYFGGSSAGTTLFLIFKHFMPVVGLGTGFSIAAIAFAMSAYCLQSCKYSASIP